MKIDHLLNRKYVPGATDCYGLIRDFYADNFNVQLPNYARPDDFWSASMNMYMERYRKHGFELLDVHPSEYRPADAILMAIKSEFANHAAVLMEDGQILHHMYGRLSIIEPYSGIWRNTTVAILRHKDIDTSKSTSSDNLLDYVSPQRKRQIEEALETLQQ